ncbi:universal stress protein [Clostridium magnum]|uniref:TRAP-T-associated universal stress protein TeaD n=1 Tax=Clostridium magnum DSM 2767 TaxID=1121326 RepID=A0A161WJN5_9CLOT|nr:universal stress protein [Clostridium magnum]KZL91945.1 TRAP-T-associated universal stress protein TeaD [Clostridium magnum DSM 2767]SHH28860.1 Nucleotide-binding universal stress protein, UspA family [Clostridium magnum DSM 2767]
MYNNILLSVDGSEHSLRATQEAIKIASLVDKCMIEVVVVVDFSQSKSEVLHSQGKEELEMSRGKKLLPIEEKLKSSNLSYELKILRGEPGPTIIDYANKGNFQLVVVGSRGLNSLQEMVLGSVSHKVAKRVQCPVLIVK